MKVSDDLIYITLDRGLPFEPEENMYIYVEKEESTSNQSFLRKYCIEERNIPYLLFSTFGQFVFLPLLIYNLSHGKVMDYYNPTHQELQSVDNPNRIFTDHIIEKEQVKHGILHYIGKSNDCGYICSYCELNIEKTDTFRLFDEFLIEIYKRDLKKAKGIEFKNDDTYIRYALRGHNVCFSLGESDGDEEDEDEKALKAAIRMNSALEHKPVQNEKVDELMRELKNKVRELEQHGLKLSLIMKMLGEEFSPNVDELSPVVVDARYRIFLPEFDNKEVMMTPLLRTVYVFFLKHTDGVAIKEMPSYFDELLGIYRHITPFGDDSQVVDSIRKLCDPTNNSMNEKCSRIKQIFKCIFAEEIAKHYAISGGRAESKYISIAKCKDKVQFTTTKYTVK